MTILDRPDADEIHQGVMLASRYDIPAEIEVMREAVDLLPDEIRDGIARIFCDSKAGACFSIDLRPGLDEREAQDLAQRLLQIQDTDDLLGGHIGRGDIFFHEEWVGGFVGRDRDRVEPGL